MSQHLGLYAALEDGTVLMLESGSLSIESNINDIFTLYPNYPNPFNPVTNINYQVNETSNISINTNLPLSPILTLLKKHEIFTV